MSHGLCTSEENERFREVLKIVLPELGQKFVQNEEAQKVKEPWLENTFGVGAAQKRDLTGGAGNEAHLEVSLDGALGKHHHWLFSARQGLY